MDVWEFDPYHDSMTTAGNGGTKATQAAFTIFYNQGTQKYELEQTLQPDEQMWIDVGKLIREHVPDKNGNVLPDNLTSGSYEFRDLTNRGIGALFEGKVIYDKTYGHVAYGCAFCCGDTKPGKFFDDPLSMIPGSPVPQGVNVYNNCTLQLEDMSDVFYSSWNTANHAIATANTYGTHTGVSGGSTTSSASGILQTANRTQQCPNGSFNPGGGDILGPRIDSINPNILSAGDNNKSVTIHGAGFGPSPTVHLPSGLTSQNQQDSSDSTIVLPSVSVPANTPIGPNNITVTASGRTSNASPFTIDGPDHMVVKGDVMGFCSGCSTTVERFVTYQIIKFSGSPVFVVPNWMELHPAQSWWCT